MKVQARTRKWGEVGLVLVLGALMFGSEAIAAQDFLAGVKLGRSTHNEFSDTDRASGFGASGFASYQATAWAVEGELQWASLSQASAEQGAVSQDVTLTGGEMAARVKIWRSLSVEAGFQSRANDPAFIVQDVAAASVGLHYLSPLAAAADLWVRGGAVPWSTFSGGGEAGPGFALGMGVRVGSAGSKIHGVASYSFLRLDRRVAGSDVPIQYESFQLGIGYALF